jgi:hypothetical protein
MPYHGHGDHRDRFTFYPDDEDRSHERYPNTISPYSSYRRRRQSDPYFRFEQHSDHSKFKRRGSLPLHISHYDHFKFPDSGFDGHRDISLHEGHFGSERRDFKKIGRDKYSPPGPVTPLLQDEENKKFHSKMMKGHEKLAKNTEKAQDIVEQETTSSTSSTGKSIAQLTKPQPLQKEESFDNFVLEQPPEEKILENASTNSGTDIEKMEKDIKYPNISSYRF